MLAERINSDLKDAMKRGDSAVVSVLRMLIAAVRNKEIEKKTRPLSDEAVIDVLATEVRKRKEAVEGFEKGGRRQMADKERAEIDVVKKYLPEEASDDEIRNAVRAAIAKFGASGPKDMGKVMGEVMPAFKGRADGTAVGRIAREEMKL